MCFHTSRVIMTVSLISVTDMAQEGRINSLQEFLGKWQVHFDRIQATNSLSKSEKEEVVSGLTKLREVCDDTWLWDNAGVAKDVPLSTIFRSVWSFVGALWVGIVLLLTSPQIATTLPNLIMPTGGGDE